MPKQHLSHLRREVRERTLSYIMGALGLVTGLAWNDAIKELIDYIFPLKEHSLSAKFIYAFLITILVVTVSLYLNRLLLKDSGEDAKKEQ